MRLVATAALFALATLAVPFAQASDASPVGLWKAIDDNSGKPTALIRITEERGELRGKIEQLFRAPGEDPNPKCTLCSDARKDQPILGMTIVSGLKKDGDEYKDGERPRRRLEGRSAGLCGCADVWPLASLAAPGVATFVNTMFACRARHDWIGYANVVNSYPSNMASHDLPTR
jgi:hypothetical protein